MKPPLLPALCVVSLLGACTATPSSPGGAGTTAPVVVTVKDSITGTVTYRERMALPASAVVRLQLQDVSRQDVAATVVDSVTIRPNGRQVPLAFTLRYDTARIQENVTYALQARIVADGQLLFINDVSYPVVTRGNPKQVQMVLRRAKN
ncbi:YbaY family lipoprotein [Hymenobacter mucosus]|uniref:Putative lipoprotein n=1 Tax=Hymenobacter mucosus TaxID=1411120 RepID=A0A238Y075_9BACT|nr:YbaY family lipoprotein [Hymenobacter mucosus]SNR64547.1 putative lipoprotein [Hymenobacter mucosus]